MINPGLLREIEDFPGSRLGKGMGPGHPAGMVRAFSRWDLLVWAGGLAWTALACPGADSRVLLDQPRLLGKPGPREWAESDGKEAESGLELRFSTGIGAGSEHCLLVRHRGVKLRWVWSLNGQALGALPTGEQDQITAIPVPAAGRKADGNVLTLTGPATPDDIEIRTVEWVAAPVAEVLGEARVTVSVRDQETGRGLPCRLTVTTAGGALAPLRAERASRLAVREGVVYTADGRAEFRLRAGTYTIWASRGFEWSAVSRTVLLEPGGETGLDLSLSRELPVPGWISVDSHIHTLTDSGHGDASIDERMLTIAGEGIDLAIATDHNHHADYGPAAERMGVGGLFQHVAGNEVTTKLGHFNAFPIHPGSPVVDPGAGDWDRLLPAIRETPGVRVVILNHPRNLHSGFVPMGPTEFDPVTGRHRRERTFRGLDGFEVVTSAAMQSDIRLPFRDWFALLNRGHRLAGVGSSDTHDVNRYLLGQARTYVAADEERVAAGDLESVWQGYEEGKVLVSMGLLAEIELGGKWRVGDLATTAPGDLPVVVTVSGPSWTRADRIELYANGHLVREAAIEHPAGAVAKARQVWRLPRPSQDTYFMAIATGPGVDLPFAETPRPYQPSSREFVPRVIGATNPVWFDADGDGVFTAARALALRLVETHGTDPRRLIPALASHDAATAVQVAALCGEAGEAPPPDSAWQGIPAPVREAFESVLGRGGSPQAARTRATGSATRSGR